MEDVIMQAIAPFYKFDLFGDNASLAVAVALGFGFGFFLERAGFGSARKLTAQFYLRDLSVLKVMFSAIVTAMLGVYALTSIGLLDLSQVYLTPTFVVPQLVGGLVLGAGFIIGGYCPGTSMAGIATGRIDALVFALGLFFGLAVFAEGFNLFASWHEMTAQGKLTLPQWLGIPYGAVVAIVAALALAAFVLAERTEARFRAAH